MAAFVGFIVQSNGIYWPWALTGSVSHADISAAGGPADQWDALPTASKLQIILFIGARYAWARWNARGAGSAQGVRRERAGSAGCDASGAAVPMRPWPYASTVLPVCVY